MEWDVFQIDILVASCLGGIQCVSNRTQGGNPMPWNHPFSTHIIPNINTVEEKPKRMLQNAQRTKPVTIK